MATKKQLLAQLENDPHAVPVYYFYSTEAQPLQDTAKLVEKALNVSDVTTIDGPAPDMGTLIAAAGTMTLFAEKRVISLREISTTSMSDKDVAELATLLREIENAILIITVLHKDKRALSSKKAKQLLEAAESLGFALELKKPSKREDLQFMQEIAEALQTSFRPGAAEALLERAGADRHLLKNETEKLAAISGYSAITTEMVEQYGAHNIETDVFALIRRIFAGDRKGSYDKLQQLVALKNEAVAISGALAGNYIDMYRMQIGLEAGKTGEEVFKDMGYKLNAYRLQKVQENARCYTKENLQKAILYLSELDRHLKSSALPDKTVLLEATVAQLIRWRT